MLLQREQTEDRVVHVVVPGHAIEVAQSAGFQARVDRAFGVGNVVVERQRAGRFEVLVDALPQPAFDGFAQLAPRCPTEPGAEDAVAKGVIREAQVHASRPVRPQCTDPFEIGRFFKGERGLGREGFERVIELNEDGIVSGLVLKRLFYARLEGRDVASLLSELHQFRRNALPFETLHLSLPHQPRFNPVFRWELYPNGETRDGGHPPIAARQQEPYFAKSFIAKNIVVV